MAKKIVDIQVGDFFQDCAGHPCLCIKSDSEDVEGISLVDGSWPASCSKRNCAPPKLTLKQVVALKTVIEKTQKLSKYERVAVERNAKPGDMVYLLQAFDILNCYWFVPNPAFMLTEAEARQFCETNSTRTLSFGFKPVKMGGMEIKKTPKKK